MLDHISTISTHLPQMKVVLKAEKIIQEYILIMGGAPIIGGIPGGGALICGGADTCPRPAGVITCADGPPTPRTGPCRPVELF